MGGSLPNVTRWLETVKDKSKIYEVDTCCTVYKFRDNVYSMLCRVPRSGGGDVWSHLIIGPEKAMLIDTGFGVGNLRGLVDEITGGMEIIVANTHCHGDHSLGNYQFDTVYCHEYDAPMLIHQMYPEYWSEFCHVTDHSFFTDDDVPSFRKYNVIGVENGYVFDLGAGYEVELIWMPGHAPGGCCYLDRTNRILFCGDAMMSPNSSCLNGPIKPHLYKPEYATVSALRTELAKLVERYEAKHEFDCLFDGHNIQGSSPVYLRDLLVSCDLVIENPDENYIEVPHGARICREKKYGTAGMKYVRERV